MMPEKVSDEIENRLGDLLTAFNYRSPSPSQLPQAIQSASTINFQDHYFETPDIDQFGEKVYEQEPSIFVEPQASSLKDAGGNMTSEYASGPHGAEGERKPHESQTATKKRKNLGHARTPFEYFTLKRQRDLEINGMNGEVGDVSKRRKTTSTTNTSALVASASHTLTRGQRIDDDPGQGAATSMPDFTAKTKKEQLKQITANIPKGYDTRRAKNQKKDLDNAVKAFGYKRVQAVDGKWLLKTMETSLFNYQATVVSWMLEQECYEGKLQGGIIGDEMGMGKTVTSLACISANPAHHHPSAQSNTATLVVVPNMNMANQWLSETRVHCKAPFSTCAQIYRKGPGDNIRSYVDLQIVITTYREIRRQFPNPAAMEKLKNDCEGDNTSFQREVKAMQGELFKERWYRIILDEAHSIKDYTTTTSIACSSLASKYRWALTGTPLSNTTQELYPYLRFIGAKFCNNRRNFMRNYVGHENAKANLDALASMLSDRRRTQKDLFLGHKIIDLKPHTEQDIIIPLSHQESTLERVIDAWFMDKIRALEQLLRQGRIPKKALDDLKLARSNRLRQIVSHVFNIEKLLRYAFKPEEVRRMKTLMSNNSNPSILAQLKNTKGKRLQGLMQYEEGFRIISSFKDPMFGGSFDIDKLFGILEKDAYINKFQCAKCDKRPPEDPYIGTQCKHALCSPCLTKIIQGELGRTGGTAYVSNYLGLPCPEPGCPARMRFKSPGETLNRLAFEASRDKSFKLPAEDINDNHINKNSQKNGFLIACDRMKLDIPPSSKLTAGMIVLLDWQHHFPEDKIIVFTQWMQTGKLMGAMLQKAGIPFLYYYGDVPIHQREKAIKDFHEKPSIKVLVAGMRCGGIGLNLTAANRVIIVDLWWNVVLEKQAFGRVKRMGQNKPCHLVRILTATMIDDRVEHLQVSKAEKVNYALQDDGHVPKSLKPDELKRLFSTDEDEA